MLIGTDLYNIFIGLSLLFLLPSSIYFWKYIIEQEKKENNDLEKRWQDCE